jgi:hypothetical protein
MRQRHTVVASALMVTSLFSACTTLRPVPVRAAGAFVNIRPWRELDPRKNIILGVTTSVLGVALANGLCVCTQ